MFKNELSAFITLPESQPEIFCRYEAFLRIYNGGRANKSQLALLVEDADESRVEDIAEVIDKEFDARVDGWLRIKKSPTRSERPNYPLR